MKKVYNFHVEITLKENYGYTHPTNNEGVTASKKDTREFIADALTNWGGQFFYMHPFAPSNLRIRVTPIRDKKR